MALKRTISKAEFDKLPADVKVEYQADGEGYKLEVEGDDDTGALLRAKQREAEARKKAETKVDELTTQLEELREAGGKKAQDIATLTKEHKTALEANDKKHGERIAKLESGISKNAINAAATAIASEISKSPALLLPHIKSRLTVDLSGDEPAVKVLDAKGQPSALSLDQLKAEFVANKDFSAIIIASRASGGAGNRAPAASGGGAANPPPDQAPTLSSDLKPGDLAERIKARKAEQNGQ